MSEYLKTVLDHQAASVAFKSPDLETIARIGEGRIRRRRVAAALAGVAAVAVVAGALAVLSDRTGRDPEPVSAHWRAESVSWALGSTVHIGQELIDVGHSVRSFVRTSVGLGIVDDSDDVYSVTDNGATRIGHLTATWPNNSDQQRIVSDPRGTLVGWVNEDPPGTLVLKVYDQRTGQARSYPTSGALPPDDALFFAIDDHTAYWRTAAGIFAVDLDTGAERRITNLTGDPAHDFEVYSVENGVIAFTPQSDQTILAGRAVEGARQLIDFRGTTTGSADPVRLSPTGAWLSIGIIEIGQGEGESVAFLGSSIRVYDTATGQYLTLRMPDELKITLPSVWLNDTTLQVIGATRPERPEDQRAGLYTCTVPDGSCRLAFELEFVDLTSPPVFPDGRAYGADPNATATPR